MNDFQLANTFEIIGTTMSISTPVTFFIFNRPDLTKIVFQAIAQAKPKKLLVVAGGPRFPEEVEKCQETRAVIESVDWDCEEKRVLAPCYPRWGLRACFNWLYRLYWFIGFLRTVPFLMKPYFHLLFKLFVLY